MENINLNNIEYLTRLQIELNKVIEGHIMQREKEELLESIETLPFYKLKKLFESISDKLMDSKDGKKILKKYIKTIKESKSLKGLYSLHDAINKTNDVKDSSLFLNEALNIVSYDNVNYMNDLKKLGGIVKEALTFAESSVESINECIKTVSDVSSSIDYLYTNKKTLNNLNEYVENYTNVTKFINENKYVKNGGEETIDVNTFITEANELTKTLDSEWCKKLFENIFLSNISGGSNEDLFNNYKTSCLSLIDKNLNECEDIQTRSTFENMKNNLEKKMFIKENFTTDITNLAELEDTLLH